MSTPRSAPSQGKSSKLRPRGCSCLSTHAGLAATQDKLATIVKGRLDLLRATYVTDKTFRKEVQQSYHQEATENTTRTRVIGRTLAAMFFPDGRRLIKQTTPSTFSTR